MIHKRKINKFDFIKIKNNCSLKDTIKEMKRQATDWEKIFVNHISDRGLISEYIKNSYNFFFTNFIIRKQSSFLNE